jgi:membrane protease YdiL (CAAX protease family)
VISLVEVVVGTVIVIGHNVFRILPNEVPILFALFWVSLRLRDGGWSAPELKRPESWARVVITALVAALLLQLGSQFVIQPLATRLWHQPEQVSSVIKQSHAGAGAALRILLFVWTFAAFGEEIGYRGYLLTRAADLGNRTRSSYVAATVYVAVLFGFGHFYKGPAGVVDSTYSGLVLGAAYLLTGRNLWAPILAHGISDTFAVLAILTGLAD